MWLLRTPLLVLLLIAPTGIARQAALSPSLRESPDLRAAMPLPEEPFSEEAWRLALELVWEDDLVETLGPRARWDGTEAAQAALALEPELDRIDAFASWLAGEEAWQSATLQASSAALETGEAIWPVEALSPRTRRAILEGWRRATTYAGRLTLQKPIGRPCRTSSHFGPRFHPVLRTRLLHKGMDLAVPIGTEVLAAQSGIVRTVGKGSASGLYIVLDHGSDIRTTYMHLDRIDVRKGQRIERGQPIGLSGDTGRVTGAHLHFELQVRGEPMNPAPLLTYEPPEA